MKNRHAMYAGVFALFVSSFVFAQEGGKITEGRLDAIGVDGKAPFIFFSGGSHDSECQTTHWTILRFHNLAWRPQDRNILGLKVLRLPKSSICG